MPSWLITGAGRGIGLQTVELLLKNDANFVIATARNPNSEGLTALQREYPSTRLAVVKLDVTDSKDISIAAETVARLLPNGIDYFINNAGSNPQPLTSFDDLDLDSFLEELKFNTVHVVELLRAFLPIIRISSTKKIIFLTSALGSISVGGAWPHISNAYAISKAALNMLARKWGAVLKQEGIAVAVVHPGYVVETRLGDVIKAWMSKYSPETPETTTKEAAKSVIKVAQDLTLEESSSFYNYDGSIIGW